MRVCACFFLNLYNWNTLDKIKWNAFHAKQLWHHTQQITARDENLINRTQVVAKCGIFSLAIWGIPTFPQRGMAFAWITEPKRSNQNVNDLHCRTLHSFCESAHEPASILVLMNEWSACASVSAQEIRRHFSQHFFFSSPQFPSSHHQRQKHTVFGFFFCFVLRLHER